MLRILKIIIVGIIVDLYWFPASLNIAPGLISKKVMAILGVPLLVLHILQRKRYSAPKSLSYATAFAVSFSVMNLIAVEVNNTMDFSYANYITSFFVWLFSAYVVIQAIQWVHKKVTIKLLTSYLAAVSAFQCVLAFLMDRVELIKILVNSVFFNGNGFYEGIQRLYGIGCALDPAGTRFSIVLILIAFVVSLDLKVRHSNKSIFWFLFAFLIISSLGNIISRTTTAGMGLAIFAILMTTGLYKLQLNLKHLKVYKILFCTLLLTVPLFVYLYQNDPDTQDNLRYAFEGFFNWVETGEWKTDSTSKLNNIMWVWPEDLHGWLIGYGVFDKFDGTSQIYVSDIGYIRFLRYSGLPGLVIFALFFIYNASYFIYKYRRYKYMFLVLLVLTFVIWIKVSTDLFMLYALFYNFIDKDEAKYKPAISL